MKFRKKPVVIEATQWLTNGDHPLVRAYEAGAFGGQPWCRQCLQLLGAHGWTETLEGGHIVCPGDWIITGVAGEHYPCKPDIFDATYDRVSDSTVNPELSDERYALDSRTGCDLCATHPTDEASKYLKNNEI